MATGMGRAVLLMCGNDEADAENDGAVIARLDDRSVHAPARTTAPSRTSDFASATLAHMACLLQERIAIKTTGESCARSTEGGPQLRRPCAGRPGGWQGVYL